jgi:hypothetical protein
MTWGIFKTDSVSEAYKKMKAEEASCDKDMKKEELKGNQDKLDKNKNGKLDKKDFEMLRNEDYDDETAINKSDVPAYKRKDNKLTLADLEKERTKNKSHPETLAKNNGTKNESVEQLDEMEFDKNGVYRHHAKPGVYGGSEKEKHVVDTLAGPKKSDLEKIAAKKKVKKEDFELFNEKELDMLINEVLTSNTPAGKWISDFVHSDNPKFAGKSKEKRKQMALGAYYAAQRKESTDYESFLVLDEAVQGDIVKMDAKEIKHANMKDKQDEAEVMEPHSEGEQGFLDAHSVLVTDEPNKDGTPNGGDKAKRAEGPKGKGPGSYDAKEKLGKQGEVKEAVYKTAAGEEIDTEPTEKKTKKTFGEVKKAVSKKVDDYDSHQS